jgi:hypothetical protein
MGIQQATISVDPTSITVTGGTPVLYSLMRYGGNTVVCGVNADTDSRLKRKLNFKTSLPQVLASAPNGYSQARSSLDAIFPKLLDNGKITENAGGIYFRFDPETTAAEKLRHRQLLAQMLIDSDFAEFWDNQSTI